MAKASLGSFEARSSWLSTRFPDRPAPGVGLNDDAFAGNPLGSRHRSFIFESDSDVNQE